MTPASSEPGRGLQVAILTGMSGAGRTQAAKVLEDIGFFVIDNLPPALISRVTELAQQPGSSLDRLALVIDVRGREFFGELLDAIGGLRTAEGTDVRVLYLEADEEALVARYGQERRRHPLGGEDGVVAGIRRERELLADLRGHSDLVLDTSDLNVHELRDRLVELFGAGSSALQVAVESFGYKYGPPRDADLVLDVRFLPNPHWIEELRSYNGLDEPVREFVLNHEVTGPFVERLQDLLEVALPGYVAEGKRYLTIAIGCTGGKHRSVVIADRLADWLRERELDVPVSVEHRDLGRE